MPKVRHLSIQVRHPGARRRVTGARRRALRLVASRPVKTKRALQSAVLVTFSVAAGCAREPVHGNPPFTTYPTPSSSPEAAPTTSSAMAPATATVTEPVHWNPPPAPHPRVAVTESSDRAAATEFP